MTFFFVSLVTASRALDIHEDILLCDATAGNITLTLPPALSRDGKRYWVKKTDAGANTVTVDGHASETLDGATILVLALEDDGAEFVCDGTNWHLSFHGTGFLPLSGGTMTGDIDMGGNDIVDVGNLGVGVDPPLDFIHFSAVADSNAFRIDTDTGNLGVGNVPAAAWALSMDGSKGTAGALFVNQLGSSDWAVFFAGGTNAGSGIGMDGANGSQLQFRNAATIEMLFRTSDHSYINTAHNFLIGTTTDGAGKLQVAGDVSLLTNTLLQARYPVETISSTDTLDDTHEYVLVDATSAAFTLTLPAVATSSGKRYNIKKIDSTANIITVDGNASETIDGGLTLDLTTQFEAVVLMCNGTEWFIY